MSGHVSDRQRQGQTALQSKLLALRVEVARRGEEALDRLRVDGEDVGKVERRVEGARRLGERLDDPRVPND